MQWISENKVNIQTMQALEQENNQLFIQAYGLENELTAAVPIEQITLTVNPAYRYGIKISPQLQQQRFQSDSIAEFISYAVGCMMGRYSLDQTGVVYAQAGDKGFNDLLSEGAYQTFAVDDDGIIPLTDAAWFKQDATSRFTDFLSIIWGEDRLEDNLKFVADSLLLQVIKPKKSEIPLETIRRYFSIGFFKQHLKIYKKRPIYWLFSSGKEKAFESLVYLHRYNDGTLSRMRMQYITPLLGKFLDRTKYLESQINNADSTVNANKYKKALVILDNKQTELQMFDEKLKQVADKQISLDLDDGVKINYTKFNNLLVNVKAVSGKK